MTQPKYRYEVWERDDYEGGTDGYAAVFKNDQLIEQFSCSSYGAAYWWAIDRVAELEKKS